MGKYSNKTWRRRQIRTRPRKAKTQILPAVSESESSNKTLERGRSWIDLPDDVTASILSRLSVFDILESARTVCLTWRRICKDPMTWRTIRMEFDIHLVQQELDGNFTIRENIEEHLGQERKIAKRKEHLRQFLNFNVNKMCHHAIDLSCGNLVDISIQNCGTDELLEHMTDSSRRIRRLSIVFSAFITIEGLSKVASKLPLLEDLEVSYTPQCCKPYGISYFKQKQSYKYLEVIGRSCPLLNSFKLNKHRGGMFLNSKDNDDALAIAGTMHGLQNLQLYGNRLNCKGLHAILEGCPRLESLDIRQCKYLSLKSLGGGLRPVLKGSSQLEELKTRCFQLAKPWSERYRNSWINDRCDSDSDDDYEHLAIDKIVDIQYRAYMKHVYI